MKVANVAFLFAIAGFYYTVSASQCQGVDILAGMSSVQLMFVGPIMTGLREAATLAEASEEIPSGPYSLWTNARNKLLDAEHSQHCTVLPGTEADPVLCCKVKEYSTCHGICLPKTTLQLAGSAGGNSAGKNTVSYTTDENGDVVVVDLLSETCDPPGTSFCSEFCCDSATADSDFCNSDMDCY